MLCLCGESGVGKDTLMKKLIEKYDYRRLVTYTTRPKRDGEVNGIDYHFVTPKVFHELCAGDFFAETTSYTVANGEVWEYGTAIKDVKDDTIVILNPHGLKELKKDKSLDIIAIHLFAPHGEIWNRLRKRGDDSDEVARRMEADKKDFEDINEHVDLAINTDGRYSIDEMADLINQIYSIRRK